LPWIKSGILYLTRSMSIIKTAKNRFFETILKPTVWYWLAYILSVSKMKSNPINMIAIPK
jgi:hypothetical protein